MSAKAGTPKANTPRAIIPRDSNRDRLIVGGSGKAETLSRRDTLDHIDCIILFLRFNADRCDCRHHGAVAH